MRRILLIAVVVGVALVGLGLAVEAALATWIEGRLARAIERDPDLAARFDDVDACLPCASYTIRSPVVPQVGDSDGPPMFAAEAIEVGLLWAPLLRGETLAEIRLRAPRLRVQSPDEGGEASAFDVSWSALGEQLSPLPVERVRARRGRLELLGSPGDDAPIPLVFEDVEVDARQLAMPPAVGEARTAELDAEALLEGRAPTHARIRIPAPARDAFRIQAELRALPLPALNRYLDRVAGIDVEAGTLDARLEVRGGANRFDGRVEAWLAELDVVDLGELGDDHPGRVLWEALVGASAALADAAEGDEPLHVELDLEGRMDSPRVDAWGALAQLLRRAVLAVFTSPFEALGALVPDIGSRDGGHEE